MTGTFPDTTRVWVYQANRPFREEEVPAIRRKVKNFAQEWVSHNRQLNSDAEVFHNQFIVLMVDESKADASGCSIDTSVRFLKGLQAEYQVNLFDRLAFTYQDETGVRTADRTEFARLYAEGVINDETPVFDNLVNTLGDFQNRWVKPLGQSWHKRMV